MRALFCDTGFNSLVKPQEMPLGWLVELGCCNDQCLKKRNHRATLAVMLVEGGTLGWEVEEHWE